MGAALSDAGDQMTPPSPLTLAGMADRIDPHPTRAVGSRKNGPALFDQDRPEIEVVPDPDPVVVAPAPDAVNKKDDPDRQRRWVPLVVAIVLLVTIAMAVGALANVRGSGSLPVPLLVGLSKAQAETTAQ